MTLGEKADMKAYYITGRETDEDFYLIPTKLNKNIFLDRLEEMIGVLGEHDFISERIVAAFSLMFIPFADELKIYCEDHIDDGKGYDVCQAVIARLSELETDDDVFPNDEISWVMDISKIAKECGSTK